MPLSEIQSHLLGALHSATAGSETGEIVYCSEWLGYLPFGSYHWIEVEGREVSQHFPSDWASADLVVLAEAGHLLVVQDWRDPQDEYHRKITYHLRRAPHDLGATA